jgi:hypothetical protein
MKPAYFPANLTPSANCHWRAEGVARCDSCLICAFFLTFASSLPWWKARQNEIRSLANAEELREKVNRRER